MGRDDRDIKEYDRFGPWIFEISDDDPVPPIFQSFVDTSIPSVLSFKIPRPIERRKAKPGMDLYDFLITIREDSIEILQRKGDAVKKMAVAYTDIHSLQCSQDLLLGNFSLITGETIYSFPFNTVSEEFIDRIINIVLERFPKLPTPKEVENEVKADEWKLGPNFYRLLTKEKRKEPQYRCFGVQGQVSVASQNDSLFKRLWYGLIDKRCYESLHFSDGHLLKIIGRGTLYRYRGKPDYRVDKIFIPIASVAELEWNPDPLLNDVMIINYKLKQESFSFAVTMKNFEPYKQYLQSLNI